MVHSKFLIGALTLLLGFGAYAAELPKMHNGSSNPPQLPTQVLGCDLPGFNVSVASFGSCARNEVVTYGNAVASEAKEPLETAITNLQQQVDNMTPPALAACMQNAGNSLSAAVANATNNPKQFVVKHLTDVMAAAQAGAASVTSVNLTQQETESKRLQRFHQSFLAIVNQDPVAACVFNLSSDVQNQLIAEAVTQAEALIAQMESMYQQHFRPQVYSAVQQALSKAINIKVGAGKSAVNRARNAGKLTSQVMSSTAGLASMAVTDEIKLMARGLLSERILNPRFLKNLTALVNLYAQEQNTGKVTPKTRAKLQARLKAAEKLSEDIALELGVRVIRYYGHEVIETAGEPLVELGIEYIRGWKTTGGEVVDVPCALPSSAGGAVCAVAWWAVNITADFGAWGLKKTAVSEMHSQYDVLIDSYHQAVKANINSSQFGQNQPVYRAFAQQLPSRDQLVGLLIPEVRAMMQGMAGYHKAVGRVIGSTPTLKSGRR